MGERCARGVRWREMGFGRRGKKGKSGVRGAAATVKRG